MRSKTESYLGLAKKSGNLVVGTDSCLRLMTKGKIVLMILAEDLSENTSVKIERKASKEQIPLIRWKTKKELSDMTGEIISGVFGVTDKNFSDVILKSLTEKEEG